jgi:hypothetical protein
MGGEGGFAGGITLDHENPNVIYMSRQLLTLKDKTFNVTDSTQISRIRDTTYAVVDSTHELDKWVTKDGGVSWDSIPITRNSPKKNTRPCVPRGHREGGKIGLMWMYGDYTKYGSGGFPDRVCVYPFDETVAARAPLARAASRPTPVPIRVMAQGLSFTLQHPQTASVQVYNCTGKLVADLSLSVRRMQPGVNIITWDQLNISSGSYAIRCSDGDCRQTINTIIP